MDSKVVYRSETIIELFSITTHTHVKKVEKLFKNANKDLLPKQLSDCTYLSITASILDIISSSNSFVRHANSYHCINFTTASIKNHGSRPT